MVYIMRIIVFLCVHNVIVVWLFLRSIEKSSNCGDDRPGRAGQAKADEQINSL